MSETLESVATEAGQRQLAALLLAQAKEQGVELVGPNGLLNHLTKNVLETALDAEMAEHLGYDKHDFVGDYDVEIRRGICSTNAVESLNARYPRAIRARGHFPTEQAALKCLYLVTRSLDPTGRGKARWAIRWKPALNAFAITFNGRITPTGN